MASESSNTFDPRDPLLLACRRVARAMDLFDESAAHRLGVGRSDLRALNLLEDGPLPAAVLAERLGLTRGAVTALIDRLQASGFVERTTDQHDRRAVLVGLMPQAWQAFAEVYQPLGLRVQATTEDVAARDRDVVVDALTSMAVAFDDARRLIA